MKIVKMKDALGNLQSRIAHKDIPYHLKNGWVNLSVSLSLSFSLSIVCVCVCVCVCVDM